MSASIYNSSYAFWNDGKYFLNAPKVIVEQDVAGALLGGCLTASGLAFLGGKY